MRELPRQLGPYRLVRRLGAGGMAEVFLALAFGASGFEKRVVLKVLRPEHVGDAVYERMFIEEGRLGARLSHRNLVGVHDLGCVEGTYYVRLDYVDGADLASLLARGLPGTALALHIADELALALGAVHGLTDDEGRPLGVVHRDVTPANVLVSRLGEVKLADFGIAKATLLRDITRAGVRKGTYAYMSPEQVRGGALSPASDFFSLGTTLHELLTGRRPFDGETPLETMDRVREAHLGPLEEVEAELRPLLRACLARRPEERVASAEAFRALLSPLRRARPEAGPFELARWVQGSAGGPAGARRPTETVLEDEGAEPE
ncbi:serine/threonine-protein kinase [Hyalangium rubrum]|uniref:Serine/threonine-protein kinase n=1 Tax=Hyalangium rubrum TaxID=3103134 RepID=A0ABU5H736_9BACT|nr:serine/threonine-protein kinase [Hyalangium sp. s54d21]MDY7229278.1 serine/threonine-protein kinase [Hyalangium sp. s54d21]